MASLIRLTRLKVFFTRLSQPELIGGRARRDRLSRPEGFTLVEVLVAIFIFLASVAGLAAVTTTVINGNAISRQMTTATSLAQEKLEVLKREGFAHADLTAGNHADSGNPINAIYNRSWAVTANTPATGISTVTMTVAWSWKGTARNVQMLIFIGPN
jgi:prepilin-type N-terminal cleavage/methylation domain-containing protein